MNTIEETNETLKVKGREEGSTQKSAKPIIANTPKVLDKVFKGYADYLKILISIGLVILSIFLTVLSIFELYHLGHMIVEFIQGGIYEKDFYKDFLKGVLTFFLYIEFVLMIIKYFEEDYHFPLRYFMYIGITATLRLIIVDHESGVETLYFSGAVLLLVIGYGIIRWLSFKKEEK